MAYAITTLAMPACRRDAVVTVRELLAAYPILRCEVDIFMRSSDAWATTGSPAWAWA